MFDIGFTELVVIGVIALIVIGPERLPEVARTVGKYVGRMRRFVSKVRDDIEREVRQEELRDALKRNADLDEIKNIINDSRYTIEDEVNETRQHVVEARDDDPRGDFAQQDMLDEQQQDFDNEDYGLTDHRDYAAGERTEQSHAGKPESGMEQPDEDEIREIRRHVAEARDEDPPGDFSQQDMLDEQQQDFDNEDYGLTDHRDYAAEEQAGEIPDRPATDTRKSTTTAPATEPVAGSSRRDDGRNKKSDG